MGAALPPSRWPPGSADPPGERPHCPEEGAQGPLCTGCTALPGLYVVPCLRGARLLLVVELRNLSGKCGFGERGVRAPRPSQETRHHLWLIPYSSQAPVTLA